MFSRTADSGFTLVELLVGLLMTSIVLTGVSSALLDTTGYYHDRNLRASSDERARVLLDLIAFDLRMLGAGMPLSQDNFAIDDVALDDAPLPLLLTATADQITIRFNERGKQTVLAAEYTPSAVDLQFQVLSAENLAVEDRVYITNVSVGEDDGFQGTISEINGNTVTVDTDYQASAGGATFAIGSIVHPVAEVTYTSAADWSGITRDDGDGATLLLPSTTFTINYLSSDGTAVALPLTRDNIADVLSKLNLSVSVRSEQQLKAGGDYTATASQEVMLRNLVLNRN